MRTKTLFVLLILVFLTACNRSGNQQAGIQAENGEAIVLLPQINDSEPVVRMLENKLIVEHNLSGGFNNRQAEVSVAVNRNDPANAVAAMMNTSAGSTNGNLLVATTKDAGDTWLTQIISSAASGPLTADPMLAFDGEGRVFLVYLPVVNGNTPLSVDLQRSLDGGITWEAPVRLSSARGQDDKVAIAADDQPDSPYFGNVYVAWKWPGGPVWISRSTDHGQTFSAPLQIDGRGVSGLDLTVAKDGTVIVAYNAGSLPESSRGIYTQRSVNGGQTFEFSRKAGATNTRFEVFPIAHCNNPGAFINASIDADRSNHEDTQNVFLTWVDYESSQCVTPCSSDCPTRVYYSVSNDLGLNWSAVQTLPFAGGSQFFQWSDIDQATGDWHVAYKDTSADPAQRSTRTLMVQSSDHGESWSVPIEMSSGSGVANGWPGHYQGMAAQAGTVYAGWSDYRSNNRGDFYVGTLREALVINKDMSGPWFNTQQSGHGWTLEVLDGLNPESPDRLGAYWYVFSNGKPVWMYALGPITGQTAQLQTFISANGQFPPDTNGADLISWGTTSFNFESDSQASMVWESDLEEFGSGSIDIRKLASITASSNACRSGVYIAPGQLGHGVTVEIVQTNDGDLALIAWTTHIEGEQIWLSGRGTFTNDTINAQVTTFAGAQFPPNFNSDDVVAVPWGGLMMQFTSPDTAVISWQPVDERFMSGSLNLVRLTKLKGYVCD